MNIVPVTIPESLYVPIHLIASSSITPSIILSF